MKIGDISLCRNGMTNRVLDGDETIELLELGYDGNEYKVVKGSLSLQVRESITINENMILVPSINSKFLEYGKNHVGKLVGKNIFIVEVDNSKFDIKALYLMFKYNLLNITYTGSSIKRITKNDLVDIDIPEISDEMIDRLKDLDAYYDALEKQKNDVEQYIKGIVQKIR